MLLLRADAPIFKKRITLFPFTILLLLSASKPACALAPAGPSAEPHRDQRSQVPFSQREEAVDPSYRAHMLAKLSKVDMLALSTRELAANLTDETCAC